MDFEFIPQAQEQFTKQKLDAFEQAKHQELIDAIGNSHADIVNAIIALASIITKNRPRVKVMNPVTEVKTPDVQSVVEALQELIAVESKEVDQQPIIDAIEGLKPLLKQIPEAIEMPEPTEEVKVTNLEQLKPTLEAILHALQAEAVKEPDTITVTAPEVHVAGTDLSGLDERLLEVLNAIRAIPAPPITDMGPVYDGLEEVRNTIANLRFPVPNVITDPLIAYKVADVDDSGTVKYYGQIANDGKWVIMKEDDTTTPKTFRYSAGSGSYPTNWTNRASLTYDYLYVAING